MNMVFGNIGAFEAILIVTIVSIVVVSSLIYIGLIKVDVVFRPQNYNECKTFCNNSIEFYAPSTYMRQVECVCNMSK